MNETKQAVDSHINASKTCSKCVNERVVESCNDFDMKSDYHNIREYIEGKDDNVEFSKHIGRCRDKKHS